ncbi:hypothetical protein CR513_06794, partial [Mucuna pruriens]
MKLSTTLNQMIPRMTSILSNWMPKQGQVFSKAQNNLKILNNLLEHVFAGPTMTHPKEGIMGSGVSPYNLVTTMTMRESWDHGECIRPILKPIKGLKAKRIEVGNFDQKN